MTSRTIDISTLGVSSDEESDGEEKLTLADVALENKAMRKRKQMLKRSMPASTGAVRFRDEHTATLVQFSDGDEQKCELCGQFKLDYKPSNAWDSGPRTPIRFNHIESESSFDADEDDAVWIHEQCALWTPMIFETTKGTFRNIVKAIHEGLQLRCTVCGAAGATLKCFAKGCFRTFHFGCGKNENFHFNSTYKTYCSEHSEHSEQERSQADVHVMVENSKGLKDGSYGKKDQAHVSDDEADSDDEFFAATHLQGHFESSIPDSEIIRCFCGNNDNRKDASGAVGEEGEKERECIQCGFCRSWLHLDCVSTKHRGLDSQLLKDENFHYICPYCPYSGVDVDYGQVVSDSIALAGSLGAAGAVGAGGHNHSDAAKSKGKGKGKGKQGKTGTGTSLNQSESLRSFSDSGHVRFCSGEKYVLGFSDSLERLQQIMGIPVDKLKAKDLMNGIDICMHWGYYASSSHQDSAIHYSSPEYWGPFLSRHLDENDVDGVEIGAGKGELTLYITKHLRCAVEIEKKYAEIGPTVTSPSSMKWHVGDFFEESFLQSLLDSPPGFFVGNLPFGPALAIVFVVCRINEKRMWLDCQMRSRMKSVADIDGAGMNLDRYRIPFCLFFLPIGIFDDSKYRAALFDCMNVHVAQMHSVGRSNFGKYRFSQLKPMPDALWLLRVGRRDILNSPISFVNLRNWMPKIEDDVQRRLEKRDEIRRRDMVPMYRVGIDIELADADQSEKGEKKTKTKKKKARKKKRKKNSDTDTDSDSESELTLLELKEKERDKKKGNSSSSSSDGDIDVNLVNFRARTGHWPRCVEIREKLKSHSQRKIPRK